MKSRPLHALVLCAASFVACRTGGGTAAAKQGPGLDPGTKVAEVDGKAITYGDLQNDHEVGPKLRQAEVKALTELYDQRRNLVDEMISRRLLEEEAKAKGKTLEQWFQSDYMNSVPEPSDADAKAFYEEHKAQVPQGQSFDELKPRIKQAVRQQKLREGMGKMLDDLKAKHHVQVALEAPELPRVDVEAKGPARGPANAPVTIVEFSDFQCPYCSKEVPVIEKVLKEYDGKVRLVFRHYPLDFHPFAQKAAEAAACAQDQGKFWELHDKMFTNQGKLAVDDLKGYAKSVGLDGSRFDKCLDSGEKKPLVEEDMKAGTAAGVSGTPAFFINGVFINGAQPYEQIKQAVDRELKKKG
jgi:protein-disulfide isomerase